MRTTMLSFFCVSREVGHISHISFVIWVKILRDRAVMVMQINWVIESLVWLMTVLSCTFGN